MLRSLGDKLITLIIRRWPLVLLATLVVTILSIFPIFKLGVNTDMIALLPEEYQSVKSIHTALDKFGGFGNFWVVIDSENEELAKKYIVELVPKIEEHPDVAYVDYKTDREFFKKNQLLYVDESDLVILRDRLKTTLANGKQDVIDWLLNKTQKFPNISLETDDLNEKYKGKAGKLGAHDFFQSDDGKFFVVQIKPKISNTNIKQARKLRDDLQLIIKNSEPEKIHSSIKTTLGGTFVNRLNEYDGIIRDIKSTALFSMLGVILLICIYFRQTISIFFIVLPLFMGLSWTFAITQMAIKSLNLVTAFLFAILFGLGIDFGIHMFQRYIEGRHQGLSKESSLIEVMKNTGKACLISAVTTAAAFYGLMICDFKGFSEFGLIAGTGTMLTFLSAFLVFPAMMLAGEKLKLIKIKLPLGQSSMKSSRSSLNLSPLILIVCVAVTLVSFSAFKNIKFEYDFSQLRIRNSQNEEAKEKYYQVFNESQTPAVVIASSEKELNAIEETLAARKKDDTSPTYSSFRTIYSFIPKDQEKKLKILSEIKKMMADPIIALVNKDQLIEVAQFTTLIPDKEITVDSLPETIRRQFRGRINDGTEFGFIFPSVQLKDGKQAMEFAHDVKEIRTKNEVYNPSSEAIIFADMLEVMTRDGMKGLLIIAFLIFLFTWLDFKSLRKTIIVMVPLASGMIWMIGVMPLINLKINFFNMVIIPVLIGMGIDNGIHIYHRYLELGKGSLPTVIKTIGGGCFMATATTLIGFAGYLTANHQGLYSLGLSAVIGLSMISISTITFLPSLLGTLELLRRSKQDTAKELD